MRDWLLSNFSNDELVDLYRQNGVGIELWSRVKTTYPALYLQYKDEIWGAMVEDADTFNLILGNFISQLITKYEVTNHFEFANALAKYAVRRQAFEITNDTYNCEKD